MLTPALTHALTKERIPTRRPPGRRRPALVLLLAAAAALSAACSTGSGGQAGPGHAPVASLPGHNGTTGAAGQPPTMAQSDRDFVSFARCMRSHGVQMSDPVHRPGHSGLSIDLPTRDAATSAAYGACNHFIAKIEQIKAAGAAGQAVHDLPALTRWAQCMRSHDISMLDPTPQGQLSLGNVPGITSDFGRYSPQFRTADHACRHLLPRGVQDDGTGP
jgi:hypothetical protein